MSSYLNNLNYLELIKCITFIVNPKNIVEFGILKGDSLSAFIQSSNKTTQIKAYDIFDDFNGNHANIFEMTYKYEKYDNVTIQYGDFYQKYEEFEDDSIDILHIDIANNANVLEYCIINYLQKITKNGIIIFEGGSKERDEVEWMNKYNKPKMYPYIEKIKTERQDIQINTYGTFPSITIIKRSIL
jgi:predicted O-methyltransferase YrrM